MSLFTLKKFSLLSAILLISMLIRPDRDLQAAQTAERSFIPLGGGYGELLEDFLTHMVDQSEDDPIRILILPATYASNPTKIGPTEQTQIAAASQTLREQLEQICVRIVSPIKTCEVALLPVYHRAQADQPDLERYFRPGLTAVFIPEGRAGTPSQVIQDTRLEQLLAQAYRSGVIVVGSSSGAMLLSNETISGYGLGFGRGSSLYFGAVQMNRDSIRGLDFGLPNLVIDTHFYQRGRFGRLLNAISLPENPAVGVGVDAFGGAQIKNERIIAGVFGKYPLTILDGQTYHAVEGVTYQGARHLLRLRNVVFHLLAPGGFEYDLQTRQHSLAPPIARIERSFEAIRLPPDSGPLLISASFSGDFSALPILQQLTNLSGGTRARIAVVLTDTDDPVWITEAEAHLQKALPVELQILIPSERITQPVEIPAGTTGLILWGRDPSNVNVAQLESLKNAWLDGTPLLAIDAGSALSGSYYSAHPANPDDEKLAEALTQSVLKKNQIRIKPGLGLISASIEPNLLTNNRWGRLLALAYNQPALPAFGLNRDATILVDRNGARVVGINEVIAIDLRQASLALGTNQALVVANGILDVFTPGDLLMPDAADRSYAPLRMATPILAQPAPTRTVHPQGSGRETGTAEPPAVILTQQTPSEENLTLTPMPEEEVVVTDPRLLQSMILFGVVSVMIVLLGVWINRRRINLR